MSSSWGTHIKLSIFGESHGPAIGVVLDGLPAGEPIDLDAIAVQMGRRAPGRDRASTPRKENDLPEIQSGVLNGKTTGAPLCAILFNHNTRSADYGNLAVLPRPGHADYTGYIRYHGYNDIRGGGHFSGRLTAPLTFAGAVFRQILLRRGVHIGAHAAEIGGVQDTCFDAANVENRLLDTLSHTYFPLIDPAREGAMRDVIEQARIQQDSVGGIVECAVTGLPAGLGSPMFGGVENILSSVIFGVPAVKGLEFGDGFQTARLRGSENNDPYYMDGNVIKTRTNHCGGILGGITTGMPIILRAAIKPTSSISQEQDTVDLSSRTDAKLSVHGRHDPCIVPRAIPVIESAVAAGLIQLMQEGGAL